MRIPALLLHAGIGRNGQSLASNRLSYSVYLWPLKREDVDWEPTVARLSEILDIPADDIRQRIEQVMHARLELPRRVPHQHRGMFNTIVKDALDQLQGLARDGVRPPFFGSDREHIRTHADHFRAISRMTLQDGAPCVTIGPPEHRHGLRRFQLETRDQQAAKIAFLSRPLDEDIDRGLRKLSALVLHKCFDDADFTAPRKLIANHGRDAFALGDEHSMV